MSEQPCANCAQTDLQCTYLAIPQKKGPKGSRAKVISQIRDTQQHATPSQSSQFDFNSPPTSPYSRNPALLSKQTIETCVDFYFTNMYTTAWIMNRESLIDSIGSQIATDAELYCLTASLCAFVMVQPGTNLAVGPGSHYQGEPPQNRYGYAQMLLDDIVRVRKSFDYIESPSLDTVQTSFFLFSCYFTLERQNLCWFHLREAVTLAQIMGMHEESSYAAADSVDNVYKRRTYWLLLVTERAYALERHRPLSIHPTIDLPTAQEPNEEAVITGFLHLISLFRCIDDEFMGLWNKAKLSCSVAWLTQLQQQLTAALPADLKTTESQAADIRITLHWLRIMVWQLSITNGFLSSTSYHRSMSFKYPIEVAKDLIQDIKVLSMDSMEVHGIGLIEKLFDIACTLTDVVACVPLTPPADSTEEAPIEYLNAFLNLISQLRGGSSRYLPLLLAKVSETLPNMAPPVAPAQMSIKQGYAGASDDTPTPSPPQTMQHIAALGLDSTVPATHQASHVGGAGSASSPHNPKFYGKTAKMPFSQI
ncbi:hypothetical protein LTR10_016212 [Elasticomyces elasticus]|uniref:Xylanolytic transcriptional activator regulatory domain-containing protein n=1 Tax=Exophiala sideris TaxID=1016849 RepID=A0ABR0JNB3_9EURO|nr:hypothetical protein LTR10_016212 [Elasticomyces elasticus]KAK5037956.1 hypothetical protein LTS07_001423 [Exophiala sideris]KAK5043939.1 hypothetical protein LTR13_000293 [Exophiala sideris]KAK5067438.1 hypothetical protein LTR69_001425 [Exophiala sideris]KAK5182771.1 hypothetical protein LTR44_005162 [Eurotiomycetes sp. CCFEE 6388]